MFEIIFIMLLAAFAIGGIWAFVVSKKVKEGGIETDAVVSRIELQEWNGWSGDVWAEDSMKVYYINYTNQDGQIVEAMLSNPGKRSFKEGDKIKIKYLPDRQEYPVMVNGSMRSSRSNIPITPMR